jgi:glycerophosphoryl diester phosphodiesterase
MRQLIPAGTLLAVASLAVLAALPGTAPAPAVVAAPGALAPEADHVVAFRGYSAVAPENTLAALTSAVAVAVPRLWVDVRTTSDGELVLLADATLDRTTSCQGPVKEQAAAVVTACDAGSWFDPRFAQQRVPTLGSVLALPDVATLYIFLADATPAAALAAVPEARRGGVVFVTESEVDAAALVASAPSATVWLRADLLSSQAIELAIEAGAKGLAVGATALTQEDLDAATAKQLTVAVVDLADDRAVATVVHQGAAFAVVGRVEPAVQALSYRFRTYLPADLGRPSLPVQGFVRTLAQGDFNGDRKPDLALGVPLDDSAAESAGWAGLVLGGDRFPGPVQGQSGTEADGQWGSVLGVGDYNADRFDDLAIGYPQRDFSGTDSGAVWLIDGGPGGIGMLSRPIGSQSPAGSHMGAALVTLDYNGDTVPDLAIAAPDRTVMNVAGAGQVTVMPGLRGSGPVATGALVLDRAAEQMDPDIEVPGEPIRNERLGAALAAGDFDGDLVDDLVIGVPAADAGLIKAAGGILVAYGAASDMTGDPILKQVRELNRDAPEVPGEPERNSSFGGALVVADFDRDSHDDLVIAAPDATVNGRRNAGELVVLYGAESGFDPARSQVINQETALLPGDAESRERFGALMAAGDANGDGYPDLVLGLPDEAVAGQPNVGTLTVVYSSPTGLQPRVALQIAPATGFTGFPAGIRQAFGRSFSLSDINRDGAPDLAIGAPGLAAGGIEQGALVVAWGYSPNLPGVATPTMPPPTETPPPTITRTPRPTRTVPATVSPTPGDTPMPSATWRPPADVYLPFAARILRFPGR